MAKVNDDNDDLICRVEGLEVRAMRHRNGKYPAKEWADALDNRGTGQLHAVARIVANSLDTGRSPAGRLSKIPGSRHGLYELRVTPAGGTPPHLRLLCIRKGRILYAAHGLTKTQNR